MPFLALKIDVDTLRGTREGVPRLAALLERKGIRATFLVSVGPDHTGRAIRRVFRRGFVGKVRRTSVLQHYGLKTLLYGVLLPGPHIGRRCRQELRAVAAAGFEVGLHTHDHVRWQDGVAHANEAWTRRELIRGRDAFAEAFGRPPTVHGAAGWQMNEFAPSLQHELGFTLASDTRGGEPFMPIACSVEVPVPQLPTTLPTLDELIGRPDLDSVDPVRHLLTLTSDGRDHVYTLHAELEGGAYLKAFEALLNGWRAQGYSLGGLGESAARLDLDAIPRCTIEQGIVEGRAGYLAVQGPVTPAISS
jgi:peptidoglycan/xylan/chitin deacetylase (PgdA/CDA1 family)